MSKITKTGRVGKIVKQLKIGKTGNLIDWTNPEWAKKFKQEGLMLFFRLPKKILKAKKTLEFSLTM